VLIVAMMKTGSKKQASLFLTEMLGIITKKTGRADCSGASRCAGDPLWSSLRRQENF
jgi:hypothetical protein